MFPLPREKWLDVVRRLERANDEIRCILTDNNVRTRSTKMKFNKLNVRFNSAWVSARTPPSCRLIGDRYANERRPLIRAMFSSVSDHLLVLRLRFFFLSFHSESLVRALLLWNLRSFFILVNFPCDLYLFSVFVHFVFDTDWFDRIANAIHLYAHRSMCVCSARTVNVFWSFVRNSSFLTFARFQWWFTHFHIFLHVMVWTAMTALWLHRLLAVPSRRSSPKWNFVNHSNEIENK